MENVEVKINIGTGDAKNSVGGLSKSINDLTKSINDLQNINKTSFKKINDSVKETDTSIKETNKTINSSKDQFSKLGTVIGGAFAADKLISFGKEILETTAKFQKFEAVLTNTLGSKSEAQSSMLMIQEIAAKTPFSVEQLTESYVKLANQGFKPTSEEIIKLGDLASSTGKDFNQLSEAVLDAQSGEFERLKEFGIKAKKEGDNVSFSFKGVKTTVDNSSESIQKYILSLGELKGVSGSMAAISETLTGKMSNLGDSYDTLLKNLGGSGSVFAGAIDLLNDWVVAWGNAALTADEIKERTKLKEIAHQNEEAIKQFNTYVDNVKKADGNLFDFNKTKEKYLEGIRDEIKLGIESKNIKRLEYLLREKAAVEGVTEKVKEKSKAEKDEKDEAEKAAKKIKDIWDDLNKEMDKSTDEANKNSDEDLKKRLKAIENADKARTLQTNRGSKERLDIEIKVLEEQRDRQLTNAHLTADEIIIIKKETDEKILDLTKTFNDEVDKENQKVKDKNEKDEAKRLKDEEEQKQLKAKYETEAIDLANQAINQELMFAQEKADRETEIEIEKNERIKESIDDRLQHNIDSIQKDVEAGLLSQAGANERAKVLEDQAAKDKIAIDQKTRELQIKAFERYKKYQLAQVAINLASEISAIAVNAAANPTNAITFGGAGITQAALLSALAITKSALQVRQITSQQAPAFAEGGLVTGSGTGTSDSINARLSNGESVINANSTAQFGNILSMINEAGGGRSFKGVENKRTSGSVTTTQSAPIRAYVVESEISSSQRKSSRINRLTSY